jgi:hypothetical protein
LSRRINSLLVSIILAPVGIQKREQRFLCSRLALVFFFEQAKDGAVN